MTDQKLLLCSVVPKVISTISIYVNISVQYSDDKAAQISSQTRQTVNKADYLHYIISCLDHIYERKQDIYNEKCTESHINPLTGAKLEKCVPVEILLDLICCLHPNHS